MKSKAELNALRSEVEALNGKLAELSEEELKQVTGGLKSMLNSTESSFNPKMNRFIPIP